MKFVFAFVAALLCATPVFAHDLMIEDAVVRITPSKMAAGYVTIMNHGKKDDALLSATAPWAERIELHIMTTNDKGVMTMEKQAAFPVKADDILSLEANGKHLMIFGVKRTIAPGEKLPVTLTFQNAGAIDVDFTAKAITDDLKAPAHAHHH